MKKLFAILAATAFSVFAVGAGEFPDVEIKELKAAIDAKKVTVIDVNGTKSFNKGHIPTAINFEAEKDRLAKLLPEDKDALIVAYCGGPACMAYKEAARAARELGYRNVKHLSAGISGWRQAGMPVETPKDSKEST